MIGKINTNLRPLLFLLLILVVSVTSSLAEVKTTVTAITGRGYGITYKEAVQNAVIEVVQQHSGVRIESTTVMKQHSFDHSITSNQGREDISAFKDQFTKFVRETTSGAVSNYRVLDYGQSEDNQYWAEVEVQFRKSEYVTPGHSVDKRRKMAVNRFYVRNQTYSFGGNQISGGELSRLLTQGLVSSLTQSRKFVMLDREYLQEYQQEKDILLSGNAPWKEKLKLGQMLGADYLVFGVIEDIGRKSECHTIEITGQKQYSSTAYMVVSYRVMAMATAQLKWSDEIQVTLATDEDDVSLKQLTDKTTRTLALDLLENIYPPRIVHVESGQVLLNMGAKSYQPGTKLEVFKHGERLVDPYTKEFIGYSETQVGLIEITRSTPKITYGRIIESSEELENEMVCRRPAPYHKTVQEFDDSKRKATNAEVDSGGGVHLPFD